MIIDILKKVLPYNPPENSVVIIEREAKPVAIVTPEQFCSFEDGEEYASSLRVFADCEVLVIGVGDLAPTETTVLALWSIGAHVSGAKGISPDELKGMPSREEYVKDHAQDLAEAHARAERIADGKEQR